MIKYKMVKGLDGYYLENEFNNMCCYKQLYHGCTSRCPLFNLVDRPGDECVLQLDCGGNSRRFIFNQIEEKEKSQCNQELK